MNSWVAVAYGALDLREHALGSEGYELAATPCHPNPPRFLMGNGASLWRRLVASPVLDEDLTPEEQDMVREMEKFGLASTNRDHPARVFSIPTPWLTSFAHELVYALLGHVAEREAIDIVFIKGPTLHAQGLRARVHSGDVDCWVRPGDERRLARAMEPWGWQPAFSAFTSTPVLHSLTLRASDWGCAVDVHSWFPGMTLAGTAAFNLAMEESEARTFAGFTTRTPSAPLHAIVHALHEVRPLQGQTASRDQISGARDALAAIGEDVLSLVHKVGAEFALQEALALAFPLSRLDFTNVVVPADWHWRMQSSLVASYREALRLVPPLSRPRVIFRVLWPSPEALRAGPTGLAHPSSGLWRLRALRAKEGIRLLARSAKRPVKIAGPGE